MYRVILWGILALGLGGVPGGALAQEREAVSMLARCAQGPLEAGALSSYLTSAPESPLKERVKKACESKP